MKKPGAHQGERRTTCAGLLPLPSFSNCSWNLKLHNTHTQTHTRMHVHTHTRIHTHTHAHTHARTYTRTHAYTHTHTHTPAAACAALLPSLLLYNDGKTLANINTHACTHTRTYTQQISSHLLQPVLRYCLRCPSAHDKIILANIYTHTHAYTQRKSPHLLQPVLRCCLGCPSADVGGGSTASVLLLHVPVGCMQPQSACGPCKWSAEHVSLGACE
jgi:hypothetical protein